jgi:sulfite exporter TauE/SafE
MRAYQDMVFSTAARIVANDAQAEDIAQEVFLKAYENFDHLSASPTAGGWLKTVATLPRAFAFGTLWGWMPCGFVYTVLVMASLQFDAVRGALTMAAFGLGTAPALFAAALGAPRLAAVAARPGARQAAGSILLVSAVLTFAGPWLVHAMPGLAGLLPFDC